MGRQRRGIDRALIAVVGEGFASRLSFGFVSFALPLWAHRLGLSLTEIGLLTSLSLMVAVVLKPFMGAVADRVGHKRAVVVAVATRSLVALGLAFTGAVWQLFALRGAYGVSKSARDPAVGAMLAKHGGERTVASAFAWYATAKNTAGALGKAAAGLLLAATASNFKLVFLTGFGISLLAVFIVGRFVPSDQPRAPARTPHHDAMPEAKSSRAEGRRLLPYLGLGFVVSGVAQMLSGLLPLLATEYAGLGEAETGLLYLASAVLVMVAGPAFGWLSDNISREPVMLVRGVANITSSLLYLSMPSLAGVGAGKLTDDLGKAAFRPAWGALMKDVSDHDPARRARTMGLMSSAEDGGEILGPIVAGIVWTAWGVPTLLLLRVGAAVMAELYTVAVSGPLRRSSWRATPSRFRYRAITGVPLHESPHTARSP